MKRLALTLTATAALLLSGCSGDDELNDADRAFAAAMSPHHAQAIEMDGLVQKRSSNPAVLELSAKIAKAQAAERDVLDEWAGDDAGHGDHGDGSHGDGDHHHMEGMLSDTQLAELEAATGEAFDQLWLTFMIEHHEGAVVAAKTVIDDGRSEEVKELALQVVTVQEAEITQMKAMLDE